MKFFLLLCLSVNMAFALTDDDLLTLSKTYCEKNVEKACKIVKCANNPDECKKLMGPPDAIAEMKKEEILRMCQGSQDCIQRAVQAEKDKAMVLIGPLCAAGDQAQCFEKAILESF